MIDHEVVVLLGWLIEELNPRMAILIDSINCENYSSINKLLVDESRLIVNGSKERRRMNNTNLIANCQAIP